jgi:hypothetical protein
VKDVVVGGNLRSLRRLLRYIKDGQQGMEIFDNNKIWLVGVLGLVDVS